LSVSFKNAFRDFNLDFAVQLEELLFNRIADSFLLFSIAKVVATMAATLTLYFPKRLANAGVWITFSRQFGELQFRKQLDRRIIEIVSKRGKNPRQAGEWVCIFTRQT
jgi:hypothetical protein